MEALACHPLGALCCLSTIAVTRSLTNVPNRHDQSADATVEEGSKAGSK